MSRKILFALTMLATFLLWACNNKPQSTAPAVVTKTDTVVVSQGINSKGIGRFKNVELTHPLSKEMVGFGKQIYDTKCVACHKLTEEKLVGPGWKGVTDRRSAEWIMNFITNTQVMLDKDLVAQAEVVTCLVRMPNQDLDDYQARQIFEFMRQNDGKN
jgi:cytochrome c2